MVCDSGQLTHLRTTGDRRELSKGGKAKHPGRLKKDEAAPGRVWVVHGGTGIEPDPEEAG